MAAPTEYDRQTSFSQYSAQNPGEPHSGASLDQEFNAVKVSLDETQANLGLIQDDDGRLARGSVGRGQLDSSITIGFEAPSPWETGATYDAEISTVFKDAKFYLCLTDHTSGVFATDLAAEKWELIADLSVAAALEDGAVSTVKLADGAVTADKLASNSVATAKIVSSAVTTPKIADANVTTAKIADSNVTTAKINDDAVTTAKINTAAVTALKLAGSGLAYVGMVNGTIVESHASSACTVAIKTLAGEDPSATDPVQLIFRNVTAGTGNYVVRSVTAALSIVIPSTATMGFASGGEASRIWLTAFDDGGTVRLGVINCRSGVSIYPLGGFGVASSTAVGTGSDSAHVFYTDSAVTSKAYVTLGYLTWETGLVTAGTWAASPTRIQLAGYGVPLPGERVQRMKTQSTTWDTGTTQLPFDDTIPQNTEGKEYLTRAITPTSLANVLDIDALMVLSFDAAAYITAALFYDTSVNAVAAEAFYCGSANEIGALRISHSMLPAVAALGDTTTFKLRAGASTAGQIGFNGTSAASRFSTANKSFVQVEEIMA